MGDDRAINGYRVVLAPKARRDLARIADEETVARVQWTLDHALTATAGGHVRIASEYPYYMFVAVPPGQPVEETLLADGVPDREPEDDLNNTYFVLYKHLTDAQRGRLAIHGYPSYLVARIFTLAEYLEEVEMVEIADPE